MEELLSLLESFWIIKDNNKELFYKIKDKIPVFKSFVTEKLGYQLIINPYLIKLEKLPGVTETWMGISEFQTQNEYVIFCLLLMFLEDKGKEEQFVLSQITEYIESNFPATGKIDWTFFQHRRQLIHVLRFAEHVGLIKTNDGDDNRYSFNNDVEVLYESTGISRYFARHFTMNILNYQSYKDIENEEWGNSDTDKGIIRRQRVYRRLIMSPVVYNEGIDDVDYDYIKRQKSSLMSDLDNFLNYQLHIHQTGAMVVLDTDQYINDMFPGNRAISDIVLLMNQLILEKIKVNELTPDKNETIRISDTQFDNLIEELISRYKSGFSKEFREMAHRQIYVEVKQFMEEFHFIHIQGKEIMMMPLIGKVAGAYPDDYDGGTTNE